MSLGGDLAPAGKVTGTTATGEPYTPKASDKGLALDLTAAPRYVGLDEGPR